MDKLVELSSSSFEQENVKYEQQDKLPIHKENCNDSSSMLPDSIDYERKNWISINNKSFVFRYEHKVSVLDVAAYILKKLGSMTTMKLQKLVYYSQAWSLVWDEQSLFIESIEAWANGPVVRELFNYHRGQYLISFIVTGNSDMLNETQKETIDAVVGYYGSKSSHWLSDLTHMEDPWKLTRLGLPEMERGNRIIGLDVLAEYYGSLPP